MSFTPFALRAIWVLSPYDSTPIFERYYKSVESRAQCCPKYVSIPDSTTFIDALFVATGIRKTDAFVASRDCCKQQCWVPAYELPTPSGMLAPVVVLQHRGLLLCALPLAEWSEENEQRLFLNVAQSMDCLTMVSEQLNGDISQKSVVQSQLQRFLAMVMPFGQPICLSAVLGEQLLASGSKETVIDKMKRPVWNPITLKGKCQLVFNISEQIHCGMPHREGGILRPLISGTVYVNIGDVTECNTEFRVNLSHPKKISNLTLAPRAQAINQSDENTTISFSSTPTSRFVLCHYTFNDVPLPIEGSLTVHTPSGKSHSTLHLLLQPLKASLSRLEVILGCLSKEPIKIVKYSMGTANEEGHVIRWEVPTSKLRSKASVLEATLLTQDQQKISSCIAEVSFKLLDQTWSGCKIYPQSLTMSPVLKAKCTVGAETISGQYIIFPSL